MGLLTILWFVTVFTLFIRWWFNGFIFSKHLCQLSLSPHFYTYFFLIGFMRMTCDFSTLVYWAVCALTYRIIFVGKHLCYVQRYIQSFSESDLTLFTWFLFLKDSKHSEDNSWMLVLKMSFLRIGCCKSSSHLIHVDCSHIVLRVHTARPVTIFWR